MRKPRILISCAGGRVAYNVCYSLKHGMEDVELVGCDSNAHYLTLNSFLDRRYKSPSFESPEYIDFLERLQKRENFDLFIPQHSQEVATLGKHLPLPIPNWLSSHKVIETISDKYLSIAKFASIGLREPAQKANELDFEQIRYPVWTRYRRGSGGSRSFLATCPAQLILWTQYLHKDNGNFIVEEYLPGRDFCFTSIWYEGELLTSHVRERRGWVNKKEFGSGGTSSINEIVHDKTMNDISMRSIKCIDRNPHGTYAVDLKCDANGIPRPTEINLRFVTNIIFSSMASVQYNKPEWNLPAILVKKMLDIDDYPNLALYDALPAGLKFVKNLDMGAWVGYDLEEVLEC